MLFVVIGSVCLVFIVHYTTLRSMRGNISCLCQVAEQLMTIAYESGVNLFDTAEVYSGGK